MPKIDVGLKQIEQLIEQLAPRDQLTLVRRLENRTLPARWKNFLHQVDSRRKKHPISQRQAVRQVESNLF